MTPENKNQIITLEALTDKYIGKAGTAKRERFEFDLKSDILGEIIRQTRKKKNLTQEELGILIGVKKAQISKLESNSKDVRFSTILKVFDALSAGLKLSIEMDSV